MIHVNRTRVLAPGALTRRSGPGKKETRRAVKHFGSKVATAKTRPEFRFEAYRLPAVKGALERLFRGKCAYCECRYQGTQPMDVEHWRPKGRIDEDDPPKHGYYWLAANWANLFPSCIDCNRQRRQLTGRERREGPAGKGNRFPLAPGSRHARQPGDEAGEKPLLLDPCSDHPGDHLLFSGEREGVVAARHDTAGRPSAKAEASIEVYGLNRVGLVQDRQEVLLLILQRMFTIRRLLQLMAEGELGPHQASMVEDVLVHEMVTLHRFQRPERPFAQMARQVIEPFIAEITG